MAKGAYIGYDGVSRKSKKVYVGVSGVSRKVKNGYVGISGVARKVFQAGTPITTLSVGETVQVMEGGSLVDYILVHKGNPNTSIYDGSCDGAWLFRKTGFGGSYSIATDSEGDGLDEYIGYEGDTWCNNTFYGKLSSSVKKYVLTAKIPYSASNGGGETFPSKILTDGSPRRAFFLSLSELGFGSDGIGSKLDYFYSGTTTAANEKRACSTPYWTRSPMAFNYFYLVTGAGKRRYSNGGNVNDYRPCFIVSLDTPIEELKC